MGKAGRIKGRKKGGGLRVAKGRRVEAGKKG